MREQGHETNPRRGVSGKPWTRGLSSWRAPCITKSATHCRLVLRC